MTVEQIVERELQIIVKTLGEESQVPKKTGNLHNAIKYRQTGPHSFQVYIDEEQAPYAADLEQLKPFWNRVAMQLSYRLNTILGGRGIRQDTPDARN